MLELQLAAQVSSSMELETLEHREAAAARGASKTSEHPEHNTEASTLASNCNHRELPELHATVDVPIRS